jgi:ABC-type glycerol-3-phosphate transport system substrate-binding protein
VNIIYTKKDISSYEADLQKAYDENKSPSLFLINNYWLGRYTNRLEPLTGKVTDIGEYQLLDYEKLQEIYPPFILKDAFGLDNQMYGVPLYSDSLALYYNKNLFQQAGLTAPPATWEELKAYAKRLTRVEDGNRLQQSGIALGSGKNVSRSADILALLTLQGGGKVIDQNGYIDFNKKVEVRTSAGIQERVPGLTAIQFYSEFSDPNKEVYAWNAEQPDSLAAFIGGKTAMMFGFSYQRANIQALKAGFEFGIAPVPQLPGSTPVTVSNYWYPVVSSQKACVVNRGQASGINCGKIAWSFLSFVAQKENVADYLNAGSKAAARTDLIKEQALRTDDVGVFARQAPIARSYNKFDDSIDTIFANMLDAAARNRAGWEGEADKAATMIEGLKK